MEFNEIAVIEADVDGNPEIYVGFEYNESDDTFWMETVGSPWENGRVWLDNDSIDSLINVLQNVKRAYNGH